MNKSFKATVTEAMTVLLHVRLKAIIRIREMILCECKKSKISEYIYQCRGKKNLRIYVKKKKSYDREKSIFLTLKTYIYIVYKTI